MIATYITNNDEAARAGRNDADISDIWTEGRVLALAAQLRSAAATPIASKGLLSSYIAAFMAARGASLVGLDGPHLAFTTPDGRSGIFCWADDAAEAVWGAAWSAENCERLGVTPGSPIKEWRVTIVRN